LGGASDTDEMLNPEAIIFSLLRMSLLLLDHLHREVEHQVFELEQAFVGLILLNFSLGFFRFSCRFALLAIR